jgi:[ribosomal protein S5]-alanine N-acetyltransferase
MELDVVHEHMFASAADGYAAGVERLETPRLHLRPFTPADVDAIHAVYSDPEVMRWVGTGPLATRAATERLLESYGGHQEALGFAFWAVLERDSGELIGDAGLHRTAVGETELGYTLAKRAWGRGYATEAAGAWLDAAFGDLAIAEVIALAEPPNHASAHVLDKLGFRRDGTRMAFGREHLLFRITR